MIKQYFTDGLIGLAILLSLFRSDIDLVNINNLINYAEVQDIIQGQTAAYLPTNFHHLPNTPHAFGNRKHVDFDNEAFTAWYNNFNLHNIPHFRQNGPNDIEAFLVSGSNLISAHIQENSAPTSTVAAESNDSPVPSPTLPEEGASLYPEHIESNTSNNAVQANSSNSAAAASSEQTTVVVDVSFLLNNPFPGCNLTKEDLELIDVLWRQDEDLGVGKEVYDVNLRFELEKKQELERIRLQDTQRSQRLAKEKEEREKKEQASKWVKENFRRDGETGEWVYVQNNSGNNGSLMSMLTQPDSTSEEFPTLESALDFIFNMDPDLLAQSNTEPQQSTPSGTTDFLTTAMGGMPVDQTVQYVKAEQPELLAPALPVEHEDNGVEDNWSGLVNYLNLTANPDSNIGNSALNQDTFLLGDVNNNKDNNSAPSNTNLTSLATASYEPLSPEAGDVGDQQPTSFLLHNVSLPSVNINMTSELLPVPLSSTTCLLSGPIMGEVPPPPTSNLSSEVDFDLDNLNLFNNLTGLDETEAEDLDMTEIDSMFSTIQSDAASLLQPIMDLGGNMDTLQKLGEEMNMSMASGDSLSPHEDIDDLEGLEGAIGGSDDYGLNSTDLTALKGPSARRPKLHRFSESSNDSGFPHKGGFSSNSSNSSSYSGSPAGSSYGADGGHTNLHHGHQISIHNGSTSGNDTERDPHGSHTLAQDQVAHNHTYNTPPGQVPREVKKYAHKEPSRKGPQSRDQRRANELKIPFTLDEIIESPVETFNEMINSHKLTEPQLTLIRDIRRRGKNKVAAQNCRKRKVSVISSLSDERTDLEKARDRLMSERAHMEQETRRMRAKFAHLYAHIFQSLRDEQGQPYDPSLYSLQQSTDGNVFLVPRNVSGAPSSSSASHALASGNGSTGTSPAASSASPSPSTTSSSSSSASNKGGMSSSKKRKSMDE